MPIYRHYLLDPDSGRIHGFEDVSPADDRGAMRLDAEPRGARRQSVLAVQTMGGATIERAFQLASSGECRTMDELKRRLRRERCESVDFHLAGKLTRTQLNALMTAAH